MSLQRRRFLQLTISAALCATAERGAATQSYPTRPIRIVVGFPPGGPNDFHARLMAQWLAERLGQEVVVENKAGASGTIAMETVVRATPDGYTLLLISSADAINATLYKNLPFDLVRHIEPVAGIMRNQLVLLTSPLFPPKSIPQLFSYLSTHPNDVNMASPGYGTPQHLAGELLKTMAGMKCVFVPYKGEAPALNDLISGDVQLMFATITSSLQYIRAGKLCPLALTSTTRSRALPDTPNMQKFLPGFNIMSWAGIGAPIGTPAEILEVLNVTINEGLASPAIRDRYSSMGATTFPGSIADLRQFIVEDVQGWTKIVRSSGLQRT